jgi:SAM-dependent methyltransferase
VSGSLPFGLTEEALATAMAEPDPDALAAGTRLRRLVEPDVAAAALQQAALRRKAVTKFGAAAATMFFTRDGLEQATRPGVADHHASRFRAAGVRRVVDLGCGIGADALAFLRAGLEVVAVERDPDTAAVAAANLAGRAEVICADAEQVAADLLPPGVGAFCDPARRNAHGRVWRVTDFTPSWSLVTGLLDGRRTAGVKLGPALPHGLIPPDVEAEWLTDSGDTVEVGLWAGPGAVAGRRSALVRATAMRSEPVEDPSTSSGRHDIDGSWHRLVTGSTAEPLPVREVGGYLYEPVGAVLRSGGLTQLGRMLDAGLLDPHLAYLTAEAAVPTPFATGYAVRSRLPFDRRALRRWLADQQVGRLEIKQRGTTVDPARFRRELRPEGPNAATFVISRTPSGAVVLVVDRVS